MGRWRVGALPSNSSLLRPGQRIRCRTTNLRFSRGSMRWFMILNVLLLILLAPPSGVAGGEYCMYVGTYTGNGSDGIYGYRFDPTTGEVQPLGLAARTDNPSFLVADPKGRFLYAVNEVDTFNGQPSGAVSVFSINRGPGTLGFLQQVSSLGGGPAHLSLDRSARFLM